MKANPTTPLAATAQAFIVTVRYAGGDTWIARTKTRPAYTASSTSSAATAAGRAAAKAFGTDDAGVTLSSLLDEPSVHAPGSYLAKRFRGKTA
jgi:hypothetical protein